MYRSAYWDGKSKTIKLLTWDNEGNRIISDRPYKPYFYVEDSRGKYRSIFETKLEKIEFSTPWERTQYIKDTNIKRLFENIKPAQQFLMDEYFGLNDDPDFGKFPLKICFFDIETEPLPGNEFPDPENAKAPISLITIHNSLNNKYTTFGTKPFTGELPSDLNCEYIHCKNESRLLLEFINWIEEDHPDILSGWNLNFFDMPYVVNRIKKLLGEDVLPRLSPLGKYREVIAKTKDNPPRDYTKYMIDGMMCVDYIDVYKKFKVKLQECYKLDFIGELEVGQKKLEYEGTIGEFQLRDWNTFVLYNIRDVELLVRIDAKTNYFQLFRYLGYMGLTNLEDSLGVVAYITGALALKARKNGKILYTPIRDVESGKNEGGYVSVKPGLVKDLITYDAASLYPSCCISLNISPETEIGEFTPLEDGNIELILVNGKHIRLSKEQFDTLIKNNNLIKSPAGVLFSQKKQGILPEFMESVFNDRKKNKKKIVKLTNEITLINEILEARKNGK